jgi:hypothetical protein
MIFSAGRPHPDWVPETFGEHHEDLPDDTVLIGVFSDECEELKEWLKHNGYGGLARK